MKSNILIFFPAGFALMCYECFSTKNTDCGRYFRPYTVEATACKPSETMCALQRQDEIPGGRLTACTQTWAQKTCQKFVKSSNF